MFNTTSDLFAILLARATGGGGGGGGGGDGNCSIIAKTTAQWNATPRLVSHKDTIYVYTDFDEQNGVDIPAIKIGDGTTFVVALPFLAGSAVTVTPQQVESWNNKVTAYQDESDGENLILSKI